MATQQLNWGDPIEEFPSGEFFEGDFDGTITSIIYETNYSRFQITVSINPAEYEYEARGMVYDPDTPVEIRGYYSMGGTYDEDDPTQSTWQISNDGKSVTGGGLPRRNTRAVKLIMALREHSGVSMEGSDLGSLEGATVHWKEIKETVFNPTTQENTDRFIRYPVSPALGASGDSSAISNQEDLDEAYALIQSILVKNCEEMMSTRELPTKAIEFADEFSSEIVKLACESSTIESAIRVGKIVRVDERNIALA